MANEARVVAGTANLVRARDALRPDIDRAFTAAGFTMLGFGTTGAPRLMSKVEIHVPTDLRTTHPWQWSDDVILPQIYAAAGATGAPFAPYRWLLREVVLPNFQLFGWITLLSETVVAALLIIGYRTRLVALAGALMAIPIGLSVIYYPRADEWAWSYLLMIGLHLLLWAVPAGDHIGIDGVLRGSDAGVRKGLRVLGMCTTVVGVLGLFVARSLDFAGDAAALLGSDSGFRDADGALTRRWELKFLWFNPLWAVLTIVFGALLIIGSRKFLFAYVAAVGLAVIGVVVFAQQTFNYVRDDGTIQVVATASNVAFWGGVALAGALLARRLQRSTPSVAE